MFTTMKSRIRYAAFAIAFALMLGFSVGGLYANKDAETGVKVAYVDAGVAGVNP